MENNKCSECGKTIIGSKIKNFTKNSICKNCLQNTEDSLFKSFTPAIIYETLCQKIIGQDEAKKALSVAIATHHCRLDDNSIEKSNILLVGPTGTGKTEMARNLAQIVGVPFTIIDATTLTAHGYIGEDVEVCLHQLLMAADYNQKSAESGIIFIDEIDKLARGQEGNSDNGIATVRVQQSLLKMMEGGLVKLTKPSSINGKSSEKEFINFNTSKILFICSGAFPGLDLLVNSGKSTMGIGAKIESNISESKSINDLKVNHLVKYGMIPEFLGRVPVIVQTELLTEKDLFNILTKTKNSILDQYKRLMKAYGIDLDFSPSFLKDIVKESIDNKLGARGLRGILEKKLMDLMFHGPSYAPAMIKMDSDGMKINKSHSVKKNQVQKENVEAPKREEIIAEVAEDKKSAKAKATNK